MISRLDEKYGGSISCDEGTFLMASNQGKQHQIKGNSIKSRERVSTRE
jgi:hypothetical protein